MVHYTFRGTTIHSDTPGVEPKEYMDAVDPIEAMGPDHGLSDEEINDMVAVGRVAFAFNYICEFFVNDSFDIEVSSKLKGILEDYSEMSEDDPEPESDLEVMQIMTACRYEFLRGEYKLNLTCS